MKKALKAILWVALAFGLYVIGAILFATITDYQPEEKISENLGSEDTVSDSTLTFFNWNIGFAGLGSEMDFFYDGGKMVRPEKEWNQNYYQGILKTIEENAADFVLLQEVDKDSKRSYGFDQFSGIGSTLKSYSSFFAPNYKVNFIPLPFTNPMGGVHSGLASYSKYKPSSHTRFQFPGNYDWPNYLFFLDRCFSVLRFPIDSSEHELLVINTHNSAYDDGSLKAQQMDYMHSFLINEYEKGNYVIVGGDWNQCPPNFPAHIFAKENIDKVYQNNISQIYLPENWTWVYDETVPTNRKLSSPYDMEKTFTTLIDFYLCSPNVKPLSVKTLNQQFEYSDHQPVLMKVKLLK